MKSKTIASKQAQHSNISYTEDEKGRDKEEKQRKKEAWKRKALLAAGHRSMFARGCNLSSDTGQVLQVAAQGNQFLAEKTREMEGERCKKATRRLISILKIDISIVSDKCKEKKKENRQKKSEDEPNKTLRGTTRDSSMWRWTYWSGNAIDQQPETFGEFFIRQTPCKPYWWLARRGCQGKGSRTLPGKIMLMYGNPGSVRPNNVLYYYDICLWDAPKFYV